MDEQQHVALPKLYGAPAYARPPRMVDDSPRPFDPDDLPIAVFQTEEDRELIEHVSSGGDGDSDPHEGHHGNGGAGRPFLLRAIAGKLLRGN